MMKKNILIFSLLAVASSFASFNYTNFSSLSVGYYHNCIALENGQAKCWGDNSFGNLGVLDDLSRGDLVGSLKQSPFVALPPGDFVTQISSGSGHSCALLKSHKIKCWGDNEGGILGQGNDFPRGVHPLSMGANLPTTNLGKNFSPVFIGSGMTHNCALSDIGEVKCWGTNPFGQLGTEDTKPRGYFNSQMGEGLAVLNFGTNALGQSLKVKRLSVGYVHNCVIFTDETAKCWGNNEYGELGLGNNKSFGDSSKTMGNDLPFLNFNKSYRRENMVFRDISTGYEHSCAVIDIPSKNEFGKVFCWGQNFFGQLGQGHTGSIGESAKSLNYFMPIVFSDKTRAIKVVTGMLHTCALFENKKVRCWGRNDEGHLGLGHGRGIGEQPGDLLNVPYVNLGRYDVVDIQSKGAHTCASFIVKDKARVKCWGLNVEGALGRENNDDTSQGLYLNEMGENLLFLNL